MAQSTKRKIKRGNLRMVWNNTFSRMDFFRKTSNGRFILSTSSGKDMASGPGHTGKQLDLLSNK